jgi:hypothetical protein
MTSHGAPEPNARAAELDSVLDDFHAAASEASEPRYFGHLAPNVVFLGTDPTERWVGEEFRQFVHSHFPAGRGWTYVPRTRSVTLARDGQTAWFDEELESEWYGICRGTGVLQLHDGEWKLEQYNLSIPVPNALSAEVVARIRAERRNE